MKNFSGKGEFPNIDTSLSFSKRTQKFSIKNSYDGFLPTPSPVIGLPKLPNHSRVPSENTPIFDKTSIDCSFFKKEKDAQASKLKLNPSVKLNPIRHLIKTRKRLEPCENEKQLLSSLALSQEDLENANSSLCFESSIKKVPKSSFTLDREEKYFKVFSVYRSFDRISEEDRIDNRESSELSKFIKYFKEKETNIPLDLAVINRGTSKTNTFYGKGLTLCVGVRSQASCRALICVVFDLF
jgi:hypothetical protein